jgi:mono/diheme cytochrome c family protein
MTCRFALTAAFVVLTSTSTQVPAWASQNSGPATSATEALYKRDCAICHGAKGDGKSDLVKDEQLTMSDWTDPKSLLGRSDQQLFSIIRVGRGRMPSESAGRASDDQVHALIQLIRAMSTAQPGASAPPSAGK